MAAGAHPAAEVEPAQQQGCRLGAVGTGSGGLVQAAAVPGAGRLVVEGTRLFPRGRWSGYPPFLPEPIAVSLIVVLVAAVARWQGGRVFGGQGGSGPQDDSEDLAIRNM